MNLSYDLPEISKITDTLYLGAQPKDIQQCAVLSAPFSYVFNFSGQVKYYIACKQKVIICPFNDCDLMPDIDMLHEMSDAMLAASKKGPTLSHCAAGINRSALVLSLTLIKDGMKPKDAIALLREKRGNMVLSNNTFENWLLRNGKQFWRP